jgi:RNA polymerase sigma factor (sigma-70 family)
MIRPMTGPMQLENACDADLVRAAALGDQAAWNTLVARFQRLILSVTNGFRLSRADAADVAQTTWLRAFEHLDDMQAPHRIGAWLLTVARRECLRTLKRAGTVTPAGDALPEPEPDPATDLAAGLLAAERRDVARAALARLPQRDRALVQLLHADPQPSYSAIGRALQMPVGSIGPTRGRVLERLRRDADICRLAAA